MRHDVSVMTSVLTFRRARVPVEEGQVLLPHLFRVRVERDAALGEGIGKGAIAQPGDLGGFADGEVVFLKQSDGEEQPGAGFADVRRKVEVGMAYGE